MHGENAPLRSFHATVLRATSPPDEVPLTLSPGDPVNIGGPRPDRPGYLWAQDPSFGAGWVPRDVIEADHGDTHAIAPYCSAELAVSAGERVRLMWEDPTHSAWWCESLDSERGWVWSDNLRFDVASAP